MKHNMISLIQRVLATVGRVTLPNLSNSIGIARLRYIQTLYERPEYQNPDTFIRDFLSPPVRWFSMLQGKLQLSKLRLRPEYYYCLARTKYYDQVFTDAMRSNVNFIVNIGSGTDTRAYRYAEGLREKKIKVLECDQPQSIFIKQKLAKQKWRTDHVTYVSIDLNDGSWLDLGTWLAEISSPILVMLEGVSTYIDEESFVQFLDFIAVKLPAGSSVAYDYKIRGIDDEFGRKDGVKRPFRLPATKKDIIAFHEARGYKLQYMELSSELSSRLLPNLDRSDAGRFAEDCLLKLTVAQKIT